MKKLSAEIVEGFSKSLLASRYDSPKPTPDFHKILWRLCCSEHPFVAIAAPRGTAKSTAVTHAYGLAEALFRNSQFIVVLSRTEIQGVDFLSDIKIELTENEDLRSYFHVKRLRKDTTTDIEVEFTDGYICRILTMSVESYKRGLKWRNMRPSLVLMDDTEGDEQVMNQDRREKFARLVDGAIIPSLSDNGKLRIVGTIMHEDSYLERVMPDPKDENTEITELSMVHMVKGDMWASAKFKAHPSVDDFSILLWPEKLTEQKLQMYRDKYKSRGLLDVYSQEYLNDPIDQSVAYFKAEDLLPMEEEDYHKRLRYYAAVDFAISQSRRADYTVIAVVGMDSEGFLYVRDIRRGRWDAKEIVDEMFAVQERYQPEIFTLEGGQIEKALLPAINSEMGTPARNGVYMNLNTLPATQDKRARATPFQSRTRAGKVKFDKNASWWDDLEHELLRFPKGIHDDQVDALAWIGQTLTNLIEADTDDDIFEEEYNSEFGSMNFCIGRSSVTGY